jgi:hypothetical protein
MKTLEEKQAEMKARKVEPKISTFRKVANKVKKDEVRMICRTTLKDDNGKLIRGQYVEGSGVDYNVFIKELRTLCQSENASIYPLGKRSLFYELYNRNVVPGLNKDIFSKLYDHVNAACEIGLPKGLDDEWFVDTSRKLSYSSGDVSVADALRTRLNYLELNHWEDQSEVPIIMCEKDGHQGILERITAPLQVRLFTSKGTWSRPSLREVAKSVAELVKAGKKVVIGYIGDHDPAGIFRIEETAFEGNTSGQNTSVGLRQHLAKIGVTEGWEHIRVALTTEEFLTLDSSVLGDVGEAEYDDEEGAELITKEKKREDGCNERYIEKYGNKRADVEALGFERMREEVKAFIDCHTNAPLWEDSKERSRLEVLNGKALLNLYTRNADTPFDKEFESVYNNFLLDGSTELEAVASTQNFFEQRRDVTSQLLANMQGTTGNNDLYARLEEKLAAVKEEEAPIEATCKYCGERIIQKESDDGSEGLFWYHGADGEDGILCCWGDDEIAEPEEVTP